MSSTPGLVSIIIPVYNGDRYLRQALCSAVGQDYQPTEIILVDDGSTDKTANVAAEFPFVQYIYQSNLGVAAARNRGIKASAGEFVAFLDADDYWPLNKIRLQMEYLKDHPQIGYCFSCQQLFLDEDITQIPSWVRQEHLGTPSIGYIPSSLMVRRHVFDQIGFFDTSFEVGEDSDWFFRARDSGVQMGIVEEILLYKRVHHNNIGGDTKKSHQYLFKAVQSSLSRQRRGSSQ